MAKKSINLRVGYDMKAFSTSSQTLVRNLQKTGRQMKSIGKSMSMSLTAPIAALGGLSVKTFATFEQSMAKVKAISGATGAEFEALGKLAKDLGISTRFAASEVSDLMLNYSKLGFSSAEIQKITGATLDLALATGEDLATSATVAGGTLRAFGLDASKMGMVTDVMAKSFSSSALDLQKFEVSMSTIAPIANGLGQSLQETTAQLAVLVNNGIDASTAGTMLRNMMLKATKDGFSMDEALTEIANSTDKAGTSLKFFDTRATATALVLAANIDNVKGLNKEFMDAEGSAAAMAKIMDSTLEGAMFRLKSAVEGLGISFGEVLAPVVGKVTDFLAAMALKFSKLEPETKKIIVIVAALVAGIGPLIFAIGTATVAFGGFMTLIAGAVATSGPIILAIAGIAALGAALFRFVGSLENVKKGTEELSDTTKAISGLSEKYQKNLASEKKQLDELFDALKDSNKEGDIRKIVIDKINKTYGTTLKNLDDEKDFVKQLDTAYADLAKNMAKKVKLSLKEDVLRDLVVIENDLTTKLKNIGKAIESVAKTPFGQIIEDPSRNQDSRFAGDNQKRFDALLQEQKEFTKELEKNKIEQQKIFDGDFLIEPTKAKQSAQGVQQITEAVKKLTIQLNEIKGKNLLSKLTKEKEIKLPEIKPIDLKVNFQKSSISKATKDIIDGISEAGIKAKIKAQQVGEDMGRALTSGLQRLATEGLTQLGAFLGESLVANTMMDDQLKNTKRHYDNLIAAARNNKEEITRLEQEKADSIAEIQKSFTMESRVEKFGRGLLQSIAEFMVDFGQAMIFIGVSQKILQDGIKNMNPALAIVGGIALVAAGTALSQISQKGIGGSGSSPSPSMSSVGGGANFGSQAGEVNMVMLHTRISGRDLILVQERETAFSR